MKLEYLYRKKCVGISLISCSHLWFSSYFPHFKIEYHVIISRNLLKFNFNKKKYDQNRCSFIHFCNVIGNLFIINFMSECTKIDSVQNKQHIHFFYFDKSIESITICNVKCIRFKIEHAHTMSLVKRIIWSCWWIICVYLCTWNLLTKGTKF